MKAYWSAKPPYVDIDFTNVTDTGKQIYDSFANYVKALESCVTEQLPGVLETAEELPSKAETVKDAAENEFDNLDLMAKGKAVLAFGFNVK